MSISAITNNHFLSRKKLAVLQCFTETVTCLVLNIFMDLHSKALCLTSYSIPHCEWSQYFMASHIADWNYMFVHLQAFDKKISLQASYFISIIIVT